MDEKEFVDSIKFIYEQMCSRIEEDDIEALKEEDDIEALKLEVYGLGSLIMEYKNTNK